LSDPKSDDDAIIAQLEECGEAQVRTLLQSGGFPTHLNLRAIKWLAAKDQESRRLSDASQASQIRAALSAKNAAWIAAAAAIIAAVFAAISIVIAIWPPTAHPPTS
jgi:hypothetical protein